MSLQAHLTAVRLIAAATVIFFPRSAPAQGTTEIIAFSGQSPPEGNGAFESFSAPSLNDAGQTAFVAQLAGTTVGDEDNTGIYRAAGNGAELTTIAREKRSGVFSGGLADILSGSPDLNAGGEVAFRATYLFPQNAGGAIIPTLYRASGGTRTVIAEVGGPSPDGGPFVEFGPPSLNDDGQVAFAAKFGAGPFRGVYRGDGGAVSLIAREGQFVPPEDNGFFDYFSLFTSPAFNNAGQTAFYAWLRDTDFGDNDDEGVYRDAGGTVTEIAPESLIGRALKDLSSPAINSGGQVAYLATLRADIFFPSERRVYRNSTVIAAEGDPAPEVGEYLSFESPAVNDAGQIAFEAVLRDQIDVIGQGIYVGNSVGVLEVVRTGDGTPGGNGSFDEFGSFALNDAGQVAFWASLSGTGGGINDNEGIFLFDGNTIHEVAREGQPLAGGTIRASAPDNSLFLSPSYFNYGNGRNGLNNEGDVAFRATIDGFQQAIVRFSLPDFLDADFNHSGAVDGSDLLAWQRGNGTLLGAQHGDGDADGDGAVDEVDLAIWEAQYGLSSSTAAKTGVPEAATISLLAVAVLIHFIRRRR